MVLDGRAPASDNHCRPKRSIAVHHVFNIAIDNLFTFLDMDQDGFLDVLWSYPRCDDGTCPEAHFLVRALGCPVFLPLVCRNWSAGN
jgi:hypothetical protein